MLPRRQILTFALLGLGGFTAWKYGAPAVSNLLAEDLEFEPIERPAGFRQIKGGKTSTGFNPLFGIEGGLNEEMEEIVAEVETRVCQTLYPSFSGEKSVVPVASFSDYYCPFCRLQTQRLAEMEAASQGSIKVYWHELPLLGEASISAAKAALAAQRQGAYVNFHKRLMRTAFQVTPQYIEALAKDLSIDQDQLVSDMESEAVFRNLQESSALAQIFGFIGTPAIVVGRTVVQGEISDGQLLRLIEQERNDRSAGVCG